MNYGELSMFEICSIILSGVSHFLTVWRFDCCKVFHFAPLFLASRSSTQHCCACPLLGHVSPMIPQ